MTQGREPAIRVAFIVPRCGVEVNGGAEVHCLKIAQRMSVYWDVEVLTTCALDYTTWDNHYPPGVEVIGGVKVRRFRIEQPRDVEFFGKFCQQIFLRREEASLAEQETWMQAQGPRSPELITYVKLNKDVYDAFIFFPYLYATTYFILPLVQEKAYLAPLAHNEWPIYMSMWDTFFTRPRGFIFNTPEERDFLRARFPKTPLEGPVVGVGVDPPEVYSEERFRQQYNIRDPFLLYIGRIESAKGCDDLFHHFIELRKKETNPRKIILLGRSTMPMPEHPDVIALGFVDEQTKWDALAACDFLIMPSLYESLSMVLLEAWSVGKPVLVNGACEVLVGQCRRAQGGLWYNNFEEFSLIIERIDRSVQDQLGRQGKNFVQNTYSWSAIEDSYLRVVEGMRSGLVPSWLTREHIVWAYRLFLDREPEGESVILEKMTGPKNSKELRRDFMQSDEFRVNNPHYSSTTLSGHEPRMKIEEISSEAELQVLFEHIQDSWQYLGKTEPYWSVLAAEKFLQANIQSAATIAEFYETGKHDVNRILKTLERNQIDHTLFKSCLEYGCGLGRVTRWLAEIFDVVYGYDISQEHLKIAKEYINSKYSNILLSQLKKVKDIENLPKVDFIYSVIVLQHNPPPIIRFIIQQFIQALNPKGVALFQVPTYRLGYEFSQQKYLSREAKRREMEMHLLPQHQVFEAIGQEGGRLLEVIEDALTGSRYKEMSNTFLVQKE